MKIRTNLILGSLSILLGGQALAADRTLAPRQWTSEQANTWYAAQPWLVGYNFLPSTAVNDVEMWQAESFNAATIERELGWARNLGFNTVRVFLNQVVWEVDADGMKQRFDRLLAIADKCGMRVMPVLLDDCNFCGRDAAVGRQPDPVPGVHNSQWVSSPPLKMVLDQAAWPRLEKYVRGMVGTFGQDRRVVAWDLYNEPGNSGMGAKSQPLMEAAFRWARRSKPTQPLTVGAWRDFEGPLARRMMELSDVVSFHGYDDRAGVEGKLKICGQFRRPILCTEWLRRQAGNTFEALLPLFHEQKIGCYNWGLVAGRTQTYFPWGSPKNSPPPKQWQHDILHPDGKPYDVGEAALIRNMTQASAAPVKSAPQQRGMFYKAQTSGNMWDTWLYHHQGRYFLYYLCGHGGRWDSFALATSTDGVNWKEHGEILHKAPDAVWMGTGATWKSPPFAKDGKFYLNFSEWRGDNRTGRQTIFFAESTDLVHWQRLDKRYEFRPDPRWYNANQGDRSRWDCIWSIARPGGGLYGYWTGNPTGRPGVGFGESDDGITWRALPPPQFEAGTPHGECGAVERIGEKYYMLLGSGGKMLALVADQPEGPFRPTAKNLCVLAGHTYFARFFPSPDGLLVNHHSFARNAQVYFGLLKRAVVDPEGALRLTWWSGNDRLKREPLPIVAPTPASSKSPALLSSAFDAATGVVLEGVIQLPASPAAPRPGFYLPDGRDGSGTAILVGPAGATEIGAVRRDGTDFKRESQIDRQTTMPGSCPFRLIVCGSLLEFYLDDHLIQCHSLSQPSTGQLGLIRAEAVQGLKAWH